MRTSFAAVAVSILAADACAHRADVAPGPPVSPAQAAAPATSTPETAFRELADRAKRLIIAAVQGRPLPTELPVAPIDGDRRVIEARDPLPDVARMEFFLFAIDFFFFPTPEQDSGVRTSVVLTTQGIRIAQLKAPAYVGSAPKPLSDWLAAARPLSVMIRDAVQAKRVKALLFGESERAVVRNDKAFELLTSLVPTPAQIEVVARRVASADSTTPVGFQVFQLGWLARSPAGDLFAFQLKIDGASGNGRLQSDPLVRSERVATRSDWSASHNSRRAPRSVRETRSNLKVPELMRPGAPSRGRQCGSRRPVRARAKQVQALDKAAL